ncbi:hypothetical protein Tco_0991088 [Tanacetum coccineum]|uniref:Uncharacterized protein n=1 Tax=Tanacetum coccineum TaxID=301880 RepID=A0ABQ5EYX2_9ASTR
MADIQMIQDREGKEKGSFKTIKKARKVFILDGEGPSTTDVGPKKKTIKGKGKQDDTPLGPNKKGISSGGRGRPKPLAPDECPWAVQITKVKNSETWEVRTYNEEHKCLQSRKIIACTHKFLSKGIVDQVEKNPDIPIRALQEELQRKYELGVSRQKAFRAKAAALNQIEKAKSDTTIRLKIKGDSVSYDLMRIQECSRDLHLLVSIKESFQGHEQRFVGLDGAFMKGPYPDLKDLLTKTALMVCKIPPHSWSRSHFSDKDARDAPIITALEYIREYLMRRMVNVIAVIKKTDGPLTPSATKVMWKKSQISTTLTPPKHNTPVGRPRKNRRKSKEEKAEMVKDGKLSRAYKTVTCMKCGNLRHNSRSCKCQKDPYTGTSQTTPSTAPAKKPSDAELEKAQLMAPGTLTAPAKMNQQQRNRVWLCQTRIF